MKLNNSRSIRIFLAMGIAVIFLLLVISIGLVLGSKINYKNNNVNNKELKLVHIILRHGIRTPADTFPTDPHIDDTFYPVGWGQLTNEGKLQMYKLGKFLRERYNNFLGNYYSPEEFFSQSTDVDRTLNSIQLVNSALWPPKGEQNWGPLNWQPIPVHAESLSQDMLLLVRKPCAAYHKERDKVLASEEIKSKLTELSDLFTDLTKYTGRDVKTFDDIQDIYSTLIAERDFNLTLPEWTVNYFPDRMEEPTAFSLVLNAYNEKMNRLKGGLLLKKILNDWTLKINENDSKKLFLYGGHDSTIVNLLRTLKIWDTQIPDYGTTIFLELSRDFSGEYGIDVYLRNSTDKPLYKLIIPGCGQFCKFEQFKELTLDVIPENWDEECENDGSYTVPEPGGP